MGRWIEMRGRIIEETSEPVCAQKLNAEMNSKGVGPNYLHKKGHSLLCFCRCDGSAVSGLRSLSRLWGG